MLLRIAAGVISLYGIRRSGIIEGGRQYFWKQQANEYELTKGEKVKESSKHQKENVQIP